MTETAEDMIGRLATHLGDCIEYIDNLENSANRLDVMDDISEDMPKCGLNWRDAVDTYKEAIGDE